MGKLLTTAWLCKMFLTGVGTYNLCSANVLGPPCLVSEIYFIILVCASFLTVDSEDMGQQIQSQEINKIKKLEEGLQGHVSEPEKRGQALMTVGKYRLRTRFSSKVE